MSSIRSNSIGSLSPEDYRQIDQPFSIKNLLDKFPLQPTETLEVNLNSQSKEQGHSSLMILKFVLFTKRLFKEIHTKKALKGVLQNIYEMDRYKSSKGLQSRSREILKGQVSLRHNQLQDSQQQIAKLLAKVLLGYKGNNA